MEVYVGMPVISYQTIKQYDIKNATRYREFICFLILKSFGGKKINIIILQLLSFIQVHIQIFKQQF